MPRPLDGSSPGPVTTATGSGDDLVRRTRLFLADLDGDDVPAAPSDVEDDDEYALDGVDGAEAARDTADPEYCTGAAQTRFHETYFGDPDDPDGHGPAAEDFADPADDDDPHFDAIPFFEPPPDPDDAPPDTAGDEPAVPPRFSKPIVIGFAAVTVVVAFGLSAALLALRSSPSVVSDQPTDAPASVQVIAGPASSTPPPAPNSGVDAPIPFTASSDCPLGSTAAQGVAGTDPSRAWVCVRAGADGQVLTLDLGRPMKVTAISIVPGWVGSDTSGADQWLQHRVVTRVQWILVNGDQRISVPQNTNDVHGEAVQQMPGNGADRGILASRITMIVQQTSRAPADTPTPGADPGAPGPGAGLIDDVLGAPLNAPSAAPTSTTTAPFGGPTADSANGDPADNTFAVSSIKVIGHLPQ